MIAVNRGTAERLFGREARRFPEVDRPVKARRIFSLPRRALSVPVGRALILRGHLMQDEGCRMASSHLNPSRSRRIVITLPQDAPLHLTAASHDVLHRAAALAGLDAGAVSVVVTRDRTLITGFSSARQLYLGLVAAIKVMNGHADRIADSAAVDVVGLLHLPEDLWFRWSELQRSIDLATSWLTGVQLDQEISGERHVAHA